MAGLEAYGDEHGWRIELMRKTGCTGVSLAALSRDGDAVAAAVRLQQALARRAVVNQAQGVLIAKLHCSRDQGFAALIRLAEGQGLRLHQAAQVVVDQTAD